MEITVQQSHALMSFLGNNADWNYLFENFGLDNIVEKIEKNNDLAGRLLTEFILTEDFGFDNVQSRKKNKTRVFLEERGIILTHKILRLLAENIRWSTIDFKRDQLQERIIRNPFGAGQQFTNFLIRIMVDQELGLI